MTIEELIKVREALKVRKMPRTPEEWDKQYAQPVVEQYAFKPNGEEALLVDVVLTGCMDEFLALAEAAINWEYIRRDKPEWRNVVAVAHLKLIETAIALREKLAKVKR